MIFFYKKQIGLSNRTLKANAMYPKWKVNQLQKVHPIHTKKYYIINKIKRKDMRKTSRLNARECERLTNEVIWFSNLCRHLLWIGALWVTVVAFILCDEYPARLFKWHVLWIVNDLLVHFHWFAAKPVFGQIASTSTSSHSLTHARTQSKWIMLASKLKHFKPEKRCETILLY